LARRFAEACHERSETSCVWVRASRKHPSKHLSAALIGILWCTECLLDIVIINIEDILHSKYMVVVFDVSTSSPSAHDQMYSTVRLHHAADLAYIKSVCRSLKRLLHLAGCEPTEVAFRRVRGAVRVDLGEGAELVCGGADLGLEAMEDFDGFFFRTSYHWLFDQAI
jgi:hypothetical protein